MTPNPESSGEDAKPSTSISRGLREFAAKLPAEGALSIAEILAQTEGQGLRVAMIVLSLPFLTPIPLPGLSTLLGLVIGWLALMTILQRRSRLPDYLARRRLSVGVLRPVLRASAGLLALMEKIVRPRLPVVVVSTWGNRTISAFLILASVVLTLPFPPLVPMTNALPAYAILILATSTMVQDGWMAMVGCLLVILGAGYAVAIYLGSAALLVRIWDPLLEWWKGLFE